MTRAEAEKALKEKGVPESKCDTLLLKALRSGSSVHVQDGKTISVTCYGGSFSVSTN